MIKLFKFWITHEIVNHENVVNAFLSTESAAGRRWRLAGPAQVDGNYLLITLVWEEYP